MQKMWIRRTSNIGGPTEFFRIGLSDNSLEKVYHENFSMMQHHHYSLTEIDNMIPWERDIYINMLTEWVKEENRRMREQQSK